MGPRFTDNQISHESEMLENMSHLTKVTSQLGEANKVIRQATHEITQMQAKIERYERDNARLIDLVARLREENQRQLAMINDMQEPFHNEDTENQ